jgi:hypothetical protein
MASVPTKTAKQSIYLESNSVCVDGIGVILGGKGCSNIHIETVDGDQTFTCTIKETTDPALYGTYITVEQGHEIKPEYVQYKVMCIDSNVTLFWDNIK